MVLDPQGEYSSRWAAAPSIAAKVGCWAQTMNEWVKKAEVDDGSRPGLPNEVAEKMKALERETRELRQANEIPCKRPLISRWRSSTAHEAVISSIDGHPSVFVVEPIFRLLQITPSAYYENVDKRLALDRLSVRPQRHCVEDRDTPRLRGELPPLRREQGLAAIQAERL
ncbi:hypothetical protein [Rhizobium leguminosarum]|uniref:hypothetical protein n=1 Tax=Rhizobium leguminosarum TaxID=384 RepID=UPI00039FDEB1